MVGTNVGTAEATGSGARTVDQADPWGEHL